MLYFLGVIIAVLTQFSAFLGLTEGRFTVRVSYTRFFNARLITASPNCCTKSVQKRGIPSAEVAIGSWDRSHPFAALFNSI